TLSSVPSFTSPPPTHHRPLHSFPTRRSSDLIWLKSSHQRRLRDTHFQPGQTQTTPLSSYRTTAPQKAHNQTLSPAGIFPYQQTRSEEHTSELQSRENLVCRLLLEKKKSTPQ